MRSGVVLSASVVALVVLSTASGSRTTIPGKALYPNAVAFADRMHGALAMGEPGSRRGTIELTSDGGLTWRVVLRTRRPVVKVAAAGRRQWYAKLQNGETLRSVDAGHHWARTSAHIWGADSTCGTYCGAGIRATPADPTWTLSTTQPGAGAQGKAVYRKLNGRWKRVACTNFDGSRFFCRRASYGGIGGYGYAIGIAGNTSGFGLIWEGRGVLYATRDGGRHWSIAKAGEVSDVDFANWASVIPRGGVGFVLFQNAGVRVRLVETTNAGRTWHVVHRWR